MGPHKCSGARLAQNPSLHSYYEGPSLFCEAEPVRLQLLPLQRREPRIPQSRLYDSHSSGEEQNQARRG